MVDIHCHILPNMDDGPQSYTDFIEMAITAVDSGITSVIATPHHLSNSFINDKGTILECTIKANELLIQENIPLVIYPGQELRLNRGVLNSLDDGDILTYCNQGAYILLELPSSYVPEYTSDVIYELVLRGITPIIAHPERNRKFIENPEVLFELVQEGALTQLTAGSIIGKFGKRQKRFAEKLIKNQLSHFIASDAHNIVLRGFFLRDAYESITDKFGSEQAEVFRKNSKLLLSGQKITRKQSSQIKKKSLKLFF